MASIYKRSRDKKKKNVPYQIDDIPIGVTEAPDDEGRFKYVCALEVSRFGKVPAGLETVRVGAARYAVFEHNAHVSAIYDTYDRIWNETLFEAGYLVADGPVIERHNPTFDPSSGEGGVAIWVPLAEADQQALARNLETVESYGRYAPHYAEATSTMTARTVEMLDAFVAALPGGATLLEIGSGPGWDADYLEAQGVRVLRTDAAASFVAMQRERGKVARQLNVVTDSLGGPYHGIMMLYVAQHIGDALLPGCLAKIFDSLRPGGCLLMTYREGDGTLTERGETALSREDGGAIVVVTGSASDEELETVAAAVEPYSA